MIEFTFSVPPGLDKNAWIGTVPSQIKHGSESENDEHDVNYLYLDGRDSGTLKILAPRRPGNYDLRLHDTNDDGSEIAYASFTVKVGKGSMTLDKETYSAGEEISIEFKTPEDIDTHAWVGLFLSSVLTVMMMITMIMTLLIDI